MVEEKYINRTILYTIYLANNLEVTLKKTNVVSLLKGKNYPIVNKLSSKFISYNFLSHMTSKEIENHINKIIERGYLVEVLDPEKEVYNISATEKGIEKVSEFINDLNFFENLGSSKYLISRKKYQS